MKARLLLGNYVLSCLLLLFVNCGAFAAAENDGRILAPLGAGDSVSINVGGQPEMSSTEYVSTDGTVNVALVGAIQVAGLLPVEASSKIEKALKDGGFLVDPHVTVTIESARSQRVSVLGEVRAPGRYAVEPNTTVFDLIAQAGGLADTSADVGYITRRDSQGNVNRISVTLKNAIDERSQSITMRGGDELFVPVAAQLYIYGQVAAPGMYRIEPGMTVIQAIARAGGITAKGSQRRIELKRTGSNGKVTTIHVTPDDAVQAKDVINVKESIF